MSQAGHFNKSIFRDKRGREIRHESDFLSTRIRHADGSHGTYRIERIELSTNGLRECVAIYNFK